MVYRAVAVTVPRRSRGWMRGERRNEKEIKDGKGFGVGFGNAF